MLRRGNVDDHGLTLGETAVRELVNGFKQGTTTNAVKNGEKEGRGERVGAVEGEKEEGNGRAKDEHWEEDSEKMRMAEKNNNRKKKKKKGRQRIKPRGHQRYTKQRSR